MASSGAKPPAGRRRVSERDMDCDAAAGFFQGAGAPEGTISGHKQELLQR